jgi:hypothetical protein
VDEVEGQDVAVLGVEPFAARPAIENTLKSGKRDALQVFMSLIKFLNHHVIMLGVEPYAA